MRKVITSYRKLPIEVRKSIKNEFPLGIENEVTPIKNVITGGFFEGLLYKYNDIIYLIKTETESKQPNFDDEDLGDNSPSIEEQDEDSYNEDY